jgi:hypothetical protein
MVYCQQLLNTCVREPGEREMSANVVVNVLPLTLGVDCLVLSPVIRACNLIGVSSSLFSRIRVGRRVKNDNKHDLRLFLPPHVGRLNCFQGDAIR